MGRIGCFSPVFRLVRGYRGTNTLPGTARERRGAGDTYGREKLPPSDVASSSSDPVIHYIHASGVVRIGDRTNPTL